MQTDTPELIRLCEALARALTTRGWTMTSAESCTGGLIAASCTSLSGSSDWFERGFVSYSNASKTELLGVPAKLIAEQGAVSEPVALAMARGALTHSLAQASVAVTGIAGPGGGCATRPVGLVCFGWAADGQAWSESQRFDGDRDAVRAATVKHAIEGLLRRLPPT